MKKRTFDFYRLLHEIEFEIGSECYNGNIQNFGPGGSWEGEGRDFRYPVRFTNAEGEREKYRGKLPFTMSSSGEIAYCILGENRFSSAHYAFGANELYIMRGIKHALEKLESRFGIDFDELLKQEKTSEKGGTN
ncbi:hypothetical protein NP534_08235 [Pseudomonas sp. 39004]|uniref:hypothetical protein n=1 Tax=Pseudomonas sp. 39004 TaxID=2967213 RepID=UPI002363CA76|nr:hypothetical protein [Pseudomonas sp. 39004]MDD1960092.1 hypothetical protein [Pseudomonas sp. 39004]